MTVLIKVMDGIKTELGFFKNGNDAFSTMIKDFLKEAGVTNIPIYINEEFVGCDCEGLEDLVLKYEAGTEYGYNDGEGNSFFFSKGLTDYYWYLVYKK